MRLLKFAVLAALLALPISSANAGVLSSLLSFNGTADVLIDQSRSNFSDNDQNGDFSTGDILSGFVSIDQADPDNDNLGIIDVNSPDAVVFAFAAEVTGVDPETMVANLGPNVEVLSSLLDSDIAENITDSGTIFVALESAASPASPLDESVFDALDDFNADNGFSFVLSGGFADGTDDFFQFEPVNSGGIIGIESGGFTVFDSPFGELLPVSVVRLDGAPDSFHDTTLFNGTITNAPDGSAFDFNNNSDFAINAVPEPTAMMTFMGIFGLAFRGRRRQQA